MLHRRKFLKNTYLGAACLALPEFSLKSDELPPTASTSLKDIPIIDTHVHFWELDRLDYPWLENKSSSLSRDFVVDDYREATQEYSIEKIVFVESGRSPQQYLPEVEWVHQLADQHPLIGGMVAYFPIDQGRLAQPELEKLAAYPLVQGIRSMGNLREQLASPRYRAGLQMLTELNLSLDVHVGTTAFADFLPILDQYPNITFILNHLGLPDVKNGEYETWRTGLKQLAERPNIYCKLSGLLTRSSSEQMNRHHLKPYVHAALECFGTGRVMFGSDWPVLTRANTFNVWAQLLESLTSELSRSELTLVFSGTAKKVYQL